ncbi:hypothetical protein A5634_23510 [Mycobacterium asiaticum]|uniref:Uncharacterized protein n=1 Tax=Mycobacterium asiaticum TaxID=1790 RepID=A0A1A3P1S1_MYCAS|nr:hypothetical protein [Mycobacterium asiaticum]OBK27219.1 hypothetical protein A5634_23510 [Mycobacterium asiaticum]
MAVPDESPTADRNAGVTQVPESDEPRIIRLRLVPWDVVTMLVLLGLLVVAVTMTSWPTRLFAFTENVCQGDDCPLVPFGLNYYIYPLVWGGIGAAGTAALVGPFVSLLKGWLMSFWPVVSVGVLSLASVLGRALTDFSATYGH